MTAPFKNIGKRINDFLKTKEYDLDRTAKINVSSDAVNWNLENKLNKDGAIESELGVTHRFDRDTLTLTTSTTDAPKFEIKTKRFASKFDAKASIQDPEIEVNLCQKRPKYTLCLDTSYDWNRSHCDAAFAASYGGIDRILMGFKAEIKKEGPNAMELSDHNIGLQFDRNDDQTFSVTTENKFQKVRVGTECQVRDGYRGFAQVFYDSAAKGDNARNMGYSVGIQRKISDSTTLRGVVRDNKTASVLYTNRFKDSGVCTKLAANFDFAKPPAERANLAWKVVFGCGTPKGCCK